MPGIDDMSEIGDRELTQVTIEDDDPVPIISAAEKPEKDTADISSEREMMMSPEITDSRGDEIPVDGFSNQNEGPKFVAFSPQVETGRLPEISELGGMGGESEETQVADVNTPTSDMAPEETGEPIDVVEITSKVESLREDSALLEDSEKMSENPVVAIPVDSGDTMSVMETADTFENSDPEAEFEEPPSLNGSYVWKVDNFLAIPQKKMYSPHFNVGGHQWRILIFPRGNNGQDALSYYLDVGEDAPSYGWSRNTAFSLNILSQKDNELAVRKECQHRFNPKERDWGFTTYLSLEELLDPARGLLVNDTVIFEAQVAVSPEDVVYDSKKYTGFVGLKNQGATCYMNSLLQFLFHLPSFRKAVYHMPTVEDDLPQSSIPLALQALFYKLQYSDTSVPTNDLTKSFGWESYESFMQHDVQELNRVLCEKLEQKMKGTVVEGTIEQLFEGHHMNYIECINVDYKSTRKESFYDLQLDVKGCKDVYASFDKYVEVEMLDGENKYQAENYGLQDARKGVLFIDFPPVLQLQLKRFEYDFMRDMNVKINDRYEFPLELDLDREDGKYLSPDADRSVENKYTLHSVLVHSGGVHGGHYYAFIRPNAASQWYKFDDERVTREPNEKALDEQYGGDDENNPGMNPNLRFTRYSNAYMLVYIRKSDFPKIFCQVDERDVASHLLVRMKQEQKELLRKKKEEAESHLYVHVKVSRIGDMQRQIGKDNFYFDLVDHEKLQSFRVPRNQSFLKFQMEIEQEWEIPVQNQRFWGWIKRGNGTYRPNIPVTMGHTDEKVDMVLEKENRDGELRDIRLYLEEATEETEDISKDFLLFLKLYDPKTEELSFLGTMYVKPKSRIKDYAADIRKLAGMGPDDPFSVYEEIHFDPKVSCPKYELEDPKTFQLLKCGNGDILCIQKDYPEDVQQDCTEDSEVKYRNVDAFFDHIRNRQVIHFRHVDKPKEDVHVIELSNASSYDEVVAKLGAALQLENPNLIRLTAQNIFSQCPKPTSIKFQNFNRLWDVIHNHQMMVTDVLYFEVLDIPLRELELLKCLKVSFCNSKAEEEVLLNLRVPKSSSIEDLIAAIKENQKVTLTRPEASLRVVELYSSKVFKIFRNDESVEQINDNYWTIRAEEIPEWEEEELKSEDCYPIQAVHFTKDPKTSAVYTFGSPVLLSLKKEETLSDIREKLRLKLQASPQDLEKWKFPVVSSVNKVEYYEDQEILAPHFQVKDSGLLNDQSPFLGIEHTERVVVPRRPTNQSRSNYEKAVKIHN